MNDRDVRLPDDQQYWTELKARIVDAGNPLVDGYGVERPSFWSTLSNAAPVLAASAILAVLGSWALGATGALAEPPLEAGVVERALTPHDPLAEALATSEPPYLGQFLARTDP